jgi:arylformamidase
MRSKGLLSRGAPSPPDDPASLGGPGILSRGGPSPPDDPASQGGPGILSRGGPSPPDDPASLGGPGILDITRPLGEASPLYPGDRKPAFRKREHDGYTITDLELTTHTCTHVDAPSHYLPGGMTVDRVPLQRLMGKARVLDMRDAGDAINAAALSGKIGGAKRVLLRTRASGTGSFGEEFPHLAPDAARLLAGSGMAAVGIDSPSVEAFGSDGSVHRELLGKGVAILEFLDLSLVSEGDYLMIALPLRLEGLDGSPARVILLEEGAGRA